MEWKGKSFDDLTKEELYTIMRERVNVFVVEQNCPYPELDNDDQEAYHVWLEKQEELVCYCRIFPSGTKYEQAASIGRILVNEHYRGKQYGRMLMKQALSVVRDEWQEEQVYLQAQEYLLSFYQSYGFTVTSEMYLEDGIPHRDMLLKR